MSFQHWRCSLLLFLTYCKHTRSAIALARDHVSSLATNARVLRNTAQPRRAKNAKTEEASALSQHLAKHRVVAGPGCEVCYSCGRVCPLTASPQIRANVWRSACVPCELFAAAQRQGHLPTLHAKPSYRLRAWFCFHCPWTANNLLTQRCDCAAQPSRPDVLGVKRLRLQAAQPEAKR